MRVVFLAENYHRFYDRQWAAHPEHRGLGWTDATAQLFAEFFYQSDSQAAALRALGHTAWTYVPDWVPLQQHWARELGLWLPPYWKQIPAIVDRFWRLATRASRRDHWEIRVLSAQLCACRPDAVQVYSGVHMTPDMLRALRPLARKWICLWSSPLNEGYPYAAYDRVLTTAAKIQEEFLRRGHDCRQVQHAFDSRIPGRLETNAPRQGVVFVGSLLTLHRGRRELLEQVARRFPLEIYGPGYESLPADSPLRKAWRGEALFGLDMYRRYACAQIDLHVPADIGRPHAGAKRLFEVTGAGALLLAEDQPGLADCFKIGREIDMFCNAVEAVEKIDYYLDNEPARTAVATAGRQRTLREHVYEVRMKDWLEAVADSRPAEKGN